eukprot:SAG31_NODE_28979_length_402_cov_1.696370_2_plen_70_part_01
MANGRLLAAADTGMGHLRVQVLRAAARQLCCGPDALALAAVLAQDFKPAVLSGAVTAAQLESNMQALAVA